MTNSEKIKAMTDEELENAVHVVLSFLDKCHGGDTYLIAPDGTELSMDVGYVWGGLETLKEYAMSKKEANDD